MYDLRMSMNVPFSEDIALKPQQLLVVPFLRSYHSCQSTMFHLVLFQAGTSVVWSTPVKIIYHEEFDKNKG
jgi:hypothetical protein